jgi:hypothetical protein
MADITRHTATACSSLLMMNVFKFRDLSRYSACGRVCSANDGYYNSFPGSIMPDSSGKTGPAEGKRGDLETPPPDSGDYHFQDIS